MFVRCAQADIFVSALHDEGLPLAAMEAMACGRPAVLSDIPPHWELSGRTDFIPLSKPGDVGGFAREIAKLQEMSPQSREAIDEKCRDLVTTRFGLSRMSAGYEAVYRELTLPSS